MAASSCDFAAAASSLLALLKPMAFLAKSSDFSRWRPRFGFAFGAAFGEERDDLISRAIDIFSLLSLS
jgi:hypothetical protein